MALTTIHSNMEIASFWKVASFFMFKVRKELEASCWDMSSGAMRKKHSMQSDTERTAEFIQRVKGYPQLQC